MNLKNFKQSTSYNISFIRVITFIMNKKLHCNSTYTHKKLWKEDSAPSSFFFHTSTLEK